MRVVHSSALIYSVVMLIDNDVTVLKVSGIPRIVLCRLYSTRFMQCNVTVNDIASDKYCLLIGIIMI